ncbi:GAD-like domain-containing protein [Enemella sp. A6]|uniref:GAD-like domain-containing protein n=1 Tax=Enemella sp. A6 TaxID=3440152 RepID=UPI003EBC35B2
MSRHTDAFARNWGAPLTSREVPENYYTDFAGRVPESLFEFWRTFGFAGFGQGRFWICDPVRWQPAVDRWMNKVSLPIGDDSWLAITRSAFGEVRLWGQRTGMSAVILPWRGVIVVNDRTAQMAEEKDRNNQINAEFRGTRPGDVEPNGDDGEPLFELALERLGPVTEDTVYGFEPALTLGGPAVVDNLALLEAVTHVTLLADLSDPQVGAASS